MSTQIDNLDPGNVDLAVEWAAREGWNPGLHDAQCFAAADADAFFVGRIEGKPVATISLVEYSAKFAFLGLYIVEPAYRGQGHGHALWKAALAAAAGRSIGLDGVVAQQENYKRSGFRLAYRNVRYRGVRDAGHVIDARVVPLSAIAFDDVVAYDTAMFGVEREAFLRCWIAQPQSKALAVVRGGSIAGYGVLRRCRRGHKVGPLFADDASLADALFDALAMHVVEGEEMFLDVPEPNRAAVALAERHGMSIVFETARMYTGEAPRIPLERVFGVTTFELG